jgi:hypothetical protein
MNWLFFVNIAKELFPMMQLDPDLHQPRITKSIASS